MNNPPYHLHVSNYVADPTLFQPAELEPQELLFRWFAGNRTYPAHEYFSEISTDQLDAGISVNRANYCRAPEDVLWTHSVEEGLQPEECGYSRREGIVVSCHVEDLQRVEPKHNICFACRTTWYYCNVAHCDITLHPVLSGFSKKQRKAVRLYLASLFHPIDQPT